MKMRKAMLAFLAAICILASVCAFGVFAEGTNQVYAETNISAEQGEYGYCYVYLDDLTDLASLNVAVHYDTEQVTVTDSYNQVACSLYDSSNQNGCLQYSYIFDGEGSNAQTNLFYFCYQVNENAEVGSTYFDIVVTDAYNTAIESVDIGGSRCNFTITEKAVAKTAYIYGPSDMETSVKEEFEISYSLGDWQIASGSMVISYDPELFEFVELTNGEFLNGKIVDVNTSLDGSVYLSFLSTEYNYYRSDLLTIKFRTLKNVTDSSEIKLTVSELYDLDLNRIICDGYTTNVAITHDDTYTEDSPSMSLSASYDAQTDNVTVTIKLDKDSHLGAGDFVLNFDKNYLTYSSATKGFAPSFFNINDKNVDEGILKFSIISLSDITDAQTVLTVVFNTEHPCQDTLVDFEISGSGLADSLTNPILLNFVDANVTVPLEHTDGNDNNHLCDKGCGTIADDGCYDDNTDHACDECGATGMVDHSDGNDNNHLCDYGCGQVADDGCHDVGTDADHKCDECGADNVTVCGDNGKDHICDTDSACVKFSIGTNAHADGNDANHTCDYCGGAVDGENCHDVNTDTDHKCDECGADSVTAHTDGADNDHLCDNGCGSIADDGCYDTDKNHECDECKAAYKSEEHKDTNKDHTCDYGCSVVIGDHTDGTDNNHLCDYCNKDVGEECYDENKDHKCDECGATGMGEHTDGYDNNHLCDYGCGQIADDGCHDVNTDADHKCDECGTDNVTEHTDGNDNNHLCDNGCGEIADDGCYDTNKNHECDECGKTDMGTHADNATDNDHVCDYGCGVTLENCSGGTATCTTLAVCTICEKPYGEYAAHTFGIAWDYKVSGGHAHTCTVSGCGEHDEVQPHNPNIPAATEDNAQVCTDCGYQIAAQLNHTHNAASEWTSNTTHHWHACSGCEGRLDEAIHIYANECDTDCNACGETRTVTHNFSGDWQKDADGHWHICADECGTTDTKANHVSAGAATETSPEVCSICGWQIAPTLGHTTHTPKIEWQKNETHHWHKCTGCDVQELEKATHNDDNSDGSCDACGYTMTVTSPPHIHAHGSIWKINEDEHWNECECGDKTNKATHADGDNNGKCDTCNYTMSIGTVNPGTDPEPQPPVDNPPSDENDGLSTGAIIGIVVASVAVVGGGGFALFGFVIRKKRII